MKKHHRLTTGEITALREAYLTGATRASLARRFDVSNTTVQNHTVDLDEQSPTRHPRPAELVAGPLGPWEDQAACRGYATETFFPSSRKDEERIAAAVTVCSTCPVRAQCLTYAVRTGSSGVWGGVYISTHDVMQGAA